LGAALSGTAGPGESGAGEAGGTAESAGGPAGSFEAKTVVCWETAGFSEGAARLFEKGSRPSSRTFEVASPVKSHLVSFFVMSG
jgi:hypothetical protein